MTYFGQWNGSLQRMLCPSKSFLEAVSISAWALDFLLFENISQIVVLSSAWILKRKTICNRPEVNLSLESSPVEPGQDEQIQMEQSPRQSAGPLQVFVILSR